jgi:tetratricopeptide (TPR) repeat protein
MARNFVRLGRILAVARKAEEAEKSYKEAVNLLDRPVDVFPESALRREDLAQTLAGLANLLRDPGRRQEVEEIRRGVIRQYETLKAEFPENSRYRRDLVQSYMELVSVLWALRRHSNTAEPLRKALEVDPENPVVNNELAWLLATCADLGVRDSALAVRLAQKAVKAQPKSGDYWNTLGVAHYRYGDDKAAVAELKTAMSLRDGGDSFDWFFLAMAHQRLGDHDEAKAYFERAVQWMDKHTPHDDQLRRFRAEAETLLAEARKP